MLRSILSSNCSILVLISSILQVSQSYVVNNGTSCYLFPESLTHLGQPVDDTPAILQAFELCGVNGSVIFAKDHTFHVDQVLNTTNLMNCDVSLQGTLQFSANIPYWLSHSIHVGLQNQSTAWLFGGTNVSFRGSPDSGFDGQGQFWYTQNRNNSNQPGRPISITFYNSTNLYVDGLTIIQPQFWAIFVSYSQNVTMKNVFINATSNDEWSSENTDGADTWNSNDIVMENWVVESGDDCIAAKGNTTNLYVRNITCYRTNGMTIGSVGQYPDMPDYVENITFEDIKLFNSMDGAYIKTWQGIPASDTSNGAGGGGGSGHVRNITFRNFELTNIGLPMQISQCIYTDDPEFCDTSKVQISNITWQNFTGTSEYNIVASLHCTSGFPCPEIYLDKINIKSVNATLGLPLYNTSLQHEVYQCANIVNQNTSSGIPCNSWAPNNFGQRVENNVLAGEQDTMDFASDFPTEGSIRACTKDIDHNEL